MSTLSSVQACSAVTAAVPSRCASARQERPPSDRPLPAVFGCSAAAASASASVNSSTASCSRTGPRIFSGSCFVTHEHRHDLAEVDRAYRRATCDRVGNELGARARRTATPTARRRRLPRSPRSALGVLILSGGRRRSARSSSTAERFARAAEPMSARAAVRRLSTRSTPSVCLLIPTSSPARRKRRRSSAGSTNRPRSSSRAIPLISAMWEYDIGVPQQTTSGNGRAGGLLRRPPPPRVEWQRPFAASPERKRTLFYRHHIAAAAATRSSPPPTGTTGAEP